MDNKNSDISNEIKDIFQRIIGTIDYTDKYKVSEIPESKKMLILSYIVPIIPFIKEKQNAYIKFHTNQGMNAWVWFIILALFIWVLNTGFPKWSYIINFVLVVVTVALIALIVFGIRNVLNDKAIELPVVSKLNLVTIVCDFFGIQ